MRKHPFEVIQGVVIAHRHQDVTGLDPNRLIVHRVAMEQLEVFLHRRLRMCELPHVNALGNGEDDQEHRREYQARDRRNGLRHQVRDCGAEEHEEYRAEPYGKLDAPDRQVGWHFPAAYSLKFEAQHQHRETVESEAPDNTECVRFAQSVNIAAAADDCKDLQGYDEIDNAITGAVLLVRLPEPVGQDA